MCPPPPTEKRTCIFFSLLHHTYQWIKMKHIDKVYYRDSIITLNKLKTHFADRKQFWIVPGTIYCFCIYTTSHMLFIKNRFYVFLNEFLFHCRFSLLTITFTKFWTNEKFFKTQIRTSKCFWKIILKYWFYRFVCSGKYLLIQDDINYKVQHSVQ